jgi:hypothetical protein
MSKKIKITEDQLKRLVENNKNQMSEEMTTERIYENPEEGQVDEMSVSPYRLHQIHVLGKLKKEVHSMLDDMDGKSSDYSAGYNQALLNVLSAIDFQNGDNEEEEHTEPMDNSDEDMDESNTFPDSDPISDPMMNESIEKIKTNFKRFL